MPEDDDHMIALSNRQWCCLYVMRRRLATMSMESEAADICVGSRLFSELEPSFSQEEKEPLWTDCEGISLESQYLEFEHGTSFSLREVEVNLEEAQKKNHSSIEGYSTGSKFDSETCGEIGMQGNTSSLKTTCQVI